MDSANSKLVEQKNVLQDKQSKEAAAKEAAQAADSTAKADKDACDSLQQLLDNVDAAQKALNDSLGGKLENMVRKSL